MTFGPHLRMGWGSMEVAGGDLWLREGTTRLEGLELLVPLPVLWRERAGDWIQEPMANDLVNHAYERKPLWISKRLRFRELPGEHVEIWGGVACSERGMEALCLFPPILSYMSLHLAVPEFYPFTINWKSNKKNVSLSSSSTFSKLIEPKEEIIGTSDL